VVFVAREDETNFTADHQILTENSNKTPQFYLDKPVFFSSSDSNKTPQFSTQTNQFFFSSSDSNKSNKTPQFYPDKTVVEPAT